MHMNALLAIVIVSWIVASGSSVVAIVLAVGRSVGRAWPSIALAFIATGIGYLGYGRWSPFKFFPQLGYSYSSDSFNIYISSSWFFVAPLALGLATLLLAVWKGSRSRHPPNNTLR